MNSNIEDASNLLLRGELVAIPTETVYGLAGNAQSDEAVAKIYEAKGRPSFNPLIVHVASLEQAQHYAQFNGTALQLAKTFWPGPLTLVLPRKKDCALSLLVSAGLDSVALRMPAHPVAQQLLKACGLPLAAPSANRSGKISPTCAAHVREELGDRVSLILDGGDCEVGIESTVVDVTGDIAVVLRPGSITAEQLGINFSAQAGQPFKSPGMMESHYAPGKKLRINVVGIGEGEALLAFGPNVPAAKIVQNLSPTGDLREAAANLFRMLRLLDSSDATGIAAMPIPETGLGIAINDRLTRASS